MRQLKFVYAVFFCGLVQLVQAQWIDYYQGYLGTRTFQSSSKLDPLTQLPTNIFAGYTPAQVLGGQVYRQVTDHLCVGAGFDMANTFKKNYNMAMAKLNTSLKFNLNNIESFLSPYVMIGANYSFISIIQRAYQEEVIPDLSGVDQNGSLIYQNRIVYREEYVNLIFIPIYGVQLGGGLEFKLTEGYGLYAQYQFDVTFASKSYFLKETFPNQKDDFRYQSLLLGIRFFM